MDRVGGNEFIYTFCQVPEGAGTGCAECTPAGKEEPPRPVHSRRARWKCRNKALRSLKTEMGIHLFTSSNRAASNGVGERGMEMWEKKKAGAALNWSTPSLHVFLHCASPLSKTLELEVRI